MNILIVSRSVLPATLYGGTQRVIWSLGKELHNLGHKITFLAPKGSHSDFARIITFNPHAPLSVQIPPETDIVHFNHQPAEAILKPYVVTQHGNTRNINYQFDRNTIFVSSNHAARYGSQSFVYNGLDWSEYKTPNLTNERKFFHFLGNAAWRSKNVRGAIKVTRSAHEKLKVMGGHRLNIKMDFRFTPFPSVSFAGMVNDQRKSDYLNQSKGLVFPIMWYEPFGLAITESLYFGCPVFGTPYGALPELVNKEIGFLSANADELTDALVNADQYSKQTCHACARDLFNAKVMARAYLAKYEKVLNGEFLNDQQPQLLEEQIDRFLPFN